METVAASDIVRSSLLTLWVNVAGFLPRLIAALILLLIGWLVAVLLGKVAWHLVRVLHIDSGLESVGFKKVWERSGFKLNSAHFFAQLVKWFFVIVFFMSAADILGLDQIAQFLNSVVMYIPNVVVAAVVLIIGMLVASFLAELVRGSVRAAKLASANFLAGLTKWSVIVFSLLVALSQLNVAQEVIRIVVIGIVAAGAVAVGLAFGLGGRSHAEDFIGKMRKHLNE